MIAMLYSTAGYKKAHRHLPVVLTHSTLDKYFYLARRDKNCDNILLFALPNDVMFQKSDDSAHLSYCFEYFVE